MMFQGDESQANQSSLVRITNLVRDKINSVPVSFFEFLLSVSLLYGRDNKVVEQVRAWMKCI